MMTDKFIPVPLVSWIALQFDPMAEWPAYVGVAAVVVVAAIIALDKVGLLKKFNNTDTQESITSQRELRLSLDSLRTEIESLTSTSRSQVSIVGRLTDEIRASTQQVASMHKWIEIQDGIRKRSEAG